MMHDSVGGGNVPYGYSQGYGPPGGAQSNHINGYQIGAPTSAPAQRQRSRSRSNVGMLPQQQQQQQQQQQNPAGSIPGWARGVQAAQASFDDQPPSNEQNYASAPIQTMGSMSVPQDPGPRPNLADLKLTKKQEKKVMDSWQKAHDEWSSFQAQQQKAGNRTRGRSRSQTRFAQDPVGKSPGYPVNSIPYPTADSTSDLESRMNHLSMGGLTAQGMQNSAAARQAERGRRLSGGVLGLSGSEAQAARERSRSRQPYDRQLYDDPHDRQHHERQPHDRQPYERQPHDRPYERQPHERQSYEREQSMGGDYGSTRPAYMPTARSSHNTPGPDPSLHNVSQPGVVPMSQPSVHASSRVSNIGQYSQSSHTPAVNPYGLPPQSSHTPAVNPYGLPPQSNRTPAVNPYGLPPQSNRTPAVNPYGLPPQPSPIMHGQQIPPLASGGQFAPQHSPQFVTMTMMSGQTTNAIPIGHVSQFPQVATMAGLPPPGVPATLDLNNLPPGVVYSGAISPGGLNLGGMMTTPQISSYPATTPNTAFYALPYQAEPQPQTRRKTNINDLSHQSMRHAEPHKPNTLINTATAPPRQRTTHNIGHYTSASQPQVQPPVQPQVPQVQPPARGHHKSHSLSGYVSAAPTQRAEILSPTDTASSGSSRGAATTSFNTMNSHQSGPARPTLRTNESAGLSQATGPSGFGTRPHHVKHPSYQEQLRSPPDSSGSHSTNSDVPRVTRRPPGPNARYTPFLPQVICYDLNGEHRQPDPLRFGRFVYERDVTHEEWELFRSQILEKWAARDRAYTRYHSAVKRVAAILSAWNFAFFNPRGLDVVLFKGNERRSGPQFGQPESKIDFLTEAAALSESGSEDSEESDEEDAALKSMVGPRADAYRQQREQEKAARVEYKRRLKQRPAQQLEAPHSLVIYPIAMRNPAAGTTAAESYR